MSVMLRKTSSVPGHAAQAVLSSLSAASVSLSPRKWIVTGRVQPTTTDVITTRLDRKYDMSVEIVGPPVGIRERFVS